MQYFPEKHHRRSIRLKNWDYSSPGWYYVTLVTHAREMLFGQVVEKEIILNKIGEIVYDEWIKTSDIRTGIRLDAFIVMPNHIHGIIIIVNHRDDGRDNRPVVSTISRGVSKSTKLKQHGPPVGSLGAIMAGFKSAATKRINAYHQTPGMRVWQRNYWERVIRNDQELNYIRAYILNNPSKWDVADENEKK